MMARSFITKSGFYFNFGPIGFRTFCYKKMFVSCLRQDDPGQHQSPARDDPPKEVDLMSICQGHINGPELFNCARIADIESGLEWSTEFSKLSKSRQGLSLQDFPTKMAKFIEF